MQAINIIANHHDLIRATFEPSVVPADPNDRYSCDEDIILCRIQPSVYIEMEFLVRWTFQAEILNIYSSF